MKRIVLYPFFRLPGNGRAFFFTSPPLKKKIICAHGGKDRIIHLDETMKVRDQIKPVLF